MFIVSLLKNRNFIFILAFVLGFAAGDIFPWMEYAVIPALAVVLTVSMAQIPTNAFRPIKKVIRPAVYIFILNYVLFSFVMLLPAYFFIEDHDLWTGFVIIASAPAGVAIAPFTGILGGDRGFSLSGVIISHLLAIFLIPLYGYLFIGESFIQPVKLLILISEIIAAPFLISRLLIRFNACRFVERWRGPIVNWGLFVVIFTVISLNRDFFFTDPAMAGITALISGITVLGTGMIMEFVLKISGFDRKLMPGFILFSTVKNGGFAAAAALSLAGKTASIPAAITSVFIIIYLIYLSFRAHTFK